MRLSFGNRAAFGLLLATMVQVANADVCFMLYSMADTSNIEPAMVADLEELIRSPGVKDPTLTTWIYNDGRNFDGSGQSWPHPINGLWTSDGSKLVNETTDVKFEGSRYFTYDHTMGKMIVETTLEGEQNSDAPEVSSARTPSLPRIFSLKTNSCRIPLGHVRVLGQSHDGLRGKRVDRVLPCLFVPRRWLYWVWQRPASRHSQACPTQLVYCQHPKVCPGQRSRCS